MQKPKSHLLRFAQVVWGDWVAVGSVGSSAALIVTGYAVYQGLPWLFCGYAIAFLVVAAYRVWLKEAHECDRLRHQLAEVTSAGEKPAPLTHDGRGLWDRIVQPRSPEAYVAILSVLIVLMLLFGSLAYQADAKHFPFHIYVELAVGALMLLLTIVVVERLLDYRREQDRREQWALVRENTIERLRDIVRNYAEITGLIFLDRDLLPPDQDGPRGEIYREIGRAVGQLHDTLHQSKDADELRRHSGRMTVWAEALGPSFAALRTTVIPRILASSRNSDLTYKVLHLDNQIAQEEFYLATHHAGMLSAAPLRLVGGTVQFCALIEDFLDRIPIQH